MTSQFQQRIVGTILLVAISVIFIPDLLDGEKKYYKEELSSVPLKLKQQHNIDQSNNNNVDSDFTALKPLAKDMNISSPVVAVDKQNNIPTKNKNAPTAVASNQSNSKFNDSAWIIQLMSLRNHDNAIALVEDLKQRGYQASTKKENNFTRVIIGPNLSKQTLEKQLNELYNITGSTGTILKFSPINP